VVRRKAAMMVAFDESLRKHQDWDFALRLATIGKLGFVQSPQTYVDHSASGRMSKLTPVEASFRFLDKHGEAINTASRRGFILRAARSAALRGDREGVWELLACVEGASMPERLRGFATRAIGMHPAFGAVLRRVYISLKALESRVYPLSDGKK